MYVQPFFENSQTGETISYWLLYLLLDFNKMIGSVVGCTGGGKKQSPRTKNGYNVGKYAGWLPRPYVENRSLASVVCA